MFNLPLIRPALITVPTVTSGFNPITNGLITWYKFAEGSGTTANDSSGNGDSGTLSTSATQLPIWSAGVPSSPVSNYSLLFDGSTNQVTFSQPVTTALPMSIACWIFPLGSSVFLQYFWEVFSLETAFEYVADSNNGINFDNNINSIGTGNIINLNQWQHVVLTYDASNNAIIYVNGINQASGNVGGGLIILENFSVGCQQFNGNVADFRLYNRILSSTEVSEIYNFEG